MVATIVTAPGDRIFEQPVVVVTSLSGHDAGTRAFFGLNEACSDRLIIAEGGTRSADGGILVTIELSTSTRGGYTFRAAGAVTLSGRIAKDERGEWRIEGSEVARPKPRRLDPKPVASELSHAMPAGQAEARFEMETGGDMMGGAAREAGLAVVVRYDRREIRQVLASCRDFAKGNAIGEAGGHVLDIAECGARFRLIRRKDAIVVERENDDRGPSVVSSISIPRSTREIHGASR